MEWLVKGPLPGGYKSPTKDWVADVLIGMNEQTIEPHTAPSWTEMSTLFQMTHGLGGNHNPGGLALLYKDVNGRKAHFFALNTLTSANEANLKRTSIMHRNTAGVFSYMRNPWIWPKFAASSQYMEGVLRDFDTTFDWNGNAVQNIGQLGRPQRDTDDPQAGLRDLYCYWIDMLLHLIEGKAEVWLQAAESNFRASFGNDDKGRRWLQQVMVTDGPISTKRLKFLSSGLGKNAHRFNPNNPPEKRKKWAQSNYDSLWRTGPGFGPAGPF